MRFSMTPDDFLKGQLAQVGWHPSTIVAFEEKMSQGNQDPNKGKITEPSQYTEMQFKINGGPSKGVVIYQNFSEKAPGFIVPLLEALGAKIDKTKAQAFDVSKDKFLGKNVDIHVARGTWNNKPKNEIDGYRAYTGEVKQQPVAPAGV